ncbi:hypothetical protein IFM89_008475 [Coptis chinensis]|uniref:Pentatricopeptide repeat-containing protein n=1 Tax=Coptis chinensis TaxID=261450 RepID=A0A835H402_9MAGN|nr:hypothetical protein IFM89_008475 [Coptis chinensis]
MHALFCCGVTLYNVFVKVSESEVCVQDITLWNSIVDGYFKFGCFEDGIVQFCRMTGLGIRPDAYSLCIVLGVCSEFVAGKQIHGYIVRNVFMWDAFLESALIDMYMKCGCPMYAWRVFDKLEDKSSIVVRNVMIGGFCENGMWKKSFELYCQAKKDNCKLGSATFSNVIMVSSHADNLKFGMKVHCDVMKFGFEWEPYVCTSLVTMYGRFMQVGDVKRAFDGVLDKEIVLWNAIISACIFSNYGHQALANCVEMRFSGLQSDLFTITNILSACGTINSYDFGRRVHGEMIKRLAQSSTVVQSALLTMYAKCGYNEDAKLVFSTIKERDIAAWGSMVSGFCHNMKYEEDLNLFKAMQADGVRLDSTIVTSILSVIVALEHAELGRLIHGFAMRNGMSFDAFVGCALIDMYAKCALPDGAESVFSEMPEKNLVAWNSITCCYNRNGLPELSISFLPQIIHHGLTPDSVSITKSLIAISSLTTLLKGKAVHGYYIRLYIQSDLQVENALLDMYIKCGCLNDQIVQSDLSKWRIADDITFLALISACSHSDWFFEGVRLFHLMKEDYRIKPRMEHYVNMVDLFGRVGYLDEAHNWCPN